MPGISYALAEAMDDGHCGLPHEELTAKLIEVPPDLIETALGLYQDSLIRTGVPIPVVRWT